MYFGEKVTLLENELKDTVEKNKQLSDVVVNMMKSINKIDSGDRSKTIIISGVKEDVIVEEGRQFNNDTDKLEHIFSKIGLDENVNINDCVIERIGNPNPNHKKRLIKVNVGTNEIREKIMEECKKLKNIQDPWKNIYINRDAHPVYAKENKRIRDKVKMLKAQPGFSHESNRVKIVKGHIQVDNVITDRNLFLA